VRVRHSTAFLAEGEAADATVHRDIPICGALIPPVPPSSLYTCLPACFPHPHLLLSSLLHSSLPIWGPAYGPEDRRGLSRAAVGCLSCRGLPWAAVGRCGPPCAAVGRCEPPWAAVAREALPRGASPAPLEPLWHQVGNLEHQITKLKRGPQVFQSFRSPYWRTLESPENNLGRSVALPRCPWNPSGAKLAILNTKFAN